MCTKSCRIVDYHYGKNTLNLGTGRDLTQNSRQVDFSYNILHSDRMQYAGTPTNINKKYVMISGDCWPWQRYNSVPSTVPSS